MNSSLDAAVVLDNVTLAYDGDPAVCNLSGILVRGSLTAIVGPNGSGKSTLMKGIAGLLRPAAGLIGSAGQVGDAIAYLPQHADIERRFPISVLQTVLLGHWRRIGWTGGITRELRERAERALAAVGLEGLERRPVDTLSAGQFQRVLFARLIAQGAQLILLDEPLAAVDWRTSEDLLRLIVRWQQEGRTVAAVLHDFDQVRAYFPETLLLAREPVAWGPTRDVLMPQNLRRARHMAETWSDNVRHHWTNPERRVTPAPQRDIPVIEEENAPLWWGSVESDRPVR
jgi:zinc/manganese transport system ATP-binding protein